jgi:tRNA pseudouridine38-40 synthase
MTDSTPSQPGDRGSNPDVSGLETSTKRQASRLETPPFRNLKLVVAYDGTDFHGWQQQQAGVRTVQEELEKAAMRVLGHPLAVHGAGRTDAGVHAAGQVANFRTTSFSIPLSNFRRALNSKLPPDIAVVSANEVPAEFHASISAIGKTYRYRVFRRPLKDVVLGRFTYHYWRELDVEAMRRAGARLLGEHDFRAFAYSAEQRENTVRTLTGCQVEETGDELHVSVSGTGFLYKMVRNIVGTLMEIGRGRWDDRQIDVILDSRNRNYAGPTAPALGLCLMHVQYPTP